ncbi:MAG TPA: site-specific tyrosine recombinase/integron integrase [Candidatus Nitrosocosmicus sp.]|nr:site-specific tyrosine recombinase/integron integrase [Candidatus Nitrosocosmicus sp.]
MSPSDALIQQIIGICPDIDRGQLAAIVESFEINEKITDEGKDLKEKVELFLTAKKLEGTSINTIKTYRDGLNGFVKYIQKPVEKIVTDDIRRFLGSFSDRKIGTIKTKFSILKSFFKWLLIEDYITKDPTVKIKQPKGDKRIPKALTEDELEQVRECCETTRQKALIETLYATGCRLSEIANLNRNDVDFTNKCARVIGKGNKERTVYFNWKAVHYLKKYFIEREDNDQALFVTERKPYRRMKNRSIQREIDEIGKRTGLEKKIHPHVFRHTLATHMLEKGAGLAEVQAILGHEDPATTQNYAVLTEKKKQEAYRKYVV